MIRSGVTVSTGLALALLALAPAWGSSHREAPNITKMPKVDNTDLYAFRSYEPGRNQFVTFIANFQPGANPGDGPNYYTMDDDALYEIMIDNNGDAVEDVTFQFKFSNQLQNGRGINTRIGGKILPIALRHGGVINGYNDPDQAEYEYYTVNQVRGDRRSGTNQPALNPNTNGVAFAKPFDNAGNKSIPNYPAYADGAISTIALPGCATQGRVFAGPRAEYFAVNLGPLFDLVNFVPIQGAADPVYSSGAPFPGGITQSQDNQELIGKKNVVSIAIEVPIACVIGTGGGNIGVWSSASLPQTRVLSPNPTYANPDTQGGAFVQVSRLGMPLVNEIVIGLPEKDLFNAVKPTADAAVADYVTNPTYPEYLNGLFRNAVNSTLGTNFATLAPTNFPRRDLVATFLTGIPSLNQLQSVTASEMLRLNTNINPTPQANQRALGVVADDLAGFPNGRRPGDDVVDIVTRVAMGRLCHPIPISGVQTQLGLCAPADAPTGLVAYTDGAPSNAANVMNRFPYLNPPLRGAPRPQTQP
jgi:hypothetical protein